MTKAKFIAFEKVRRSGLTNMLDINEIRFIAVSKYGQELTKKDCFDILTSKLPAGIIWEFLAIVRQGRLTRGE